MTKDTISQNFDHFPKKKSVMPNEWGEFKWFNTIILMF